MTRFTPRTRRNTSSFRSPFGYGLEVWNRSSPLRDSQLEAAHFHRMIEKIAQLLRSPACEVDTTGTKLITCTKSSVSSDQPGSGNSVLPPESRTEKRAVGSELETPAVAL